MANPNELKLTNEEVEGDFENMPTGMSAVLTPPQPGIYTFTIPAAEVLYHAFNTQQDAKQGQRLVVEFRDEAALLMDPNAQPYHCNISNRTRVINFKSGPVVVSDMAMMLKALGIVPEAMTNPGFAKAMLAAGGKRFRGEHTLTANCSTKRDIWKDGKEQKGKKGCGQRYAVESYEPRDGSRVVLAIPKDERGQVSTRFTCACGADLRAWGTLRGFKKL
jgi:hypothetical protein